MKVGIITITTIIIIMLTYATYSANQFIHVILLISICMNTPIFQRTKLRPRVTGDTLDHTAESY